MRNKALLVLALLVVAFVLGACAPVAGSEQPNRTLSVNGVGQVFIKPDIAYIHIGVHTEDPSASNAVSKNNSQTQRVIDSLKKFGIATDDIRTVNFSIWPSQQYDRDGNLTGTVYMVDNTVFVTVRDLEMLGELLDATVKSGANSINSVQFDVADKTEAMKKARAAAVESARDQAQELADAAGVSLGEVQSISFFDSVPYPVFDGRGGGGGEAAMAVVPIQPGQITLSVTVSMTYELK